MCVAEFIECMADMCLYFKKDIDEFTMVGVCMDDLLVTGTVKHAVDKFFKDMSILNLWIWFW